MNATRAKRQVSGWMLTACGGWLIAVGVYFIFVRPALLPEDVRFMGAALTQIRVAVPGLEGWLRHVFTVMGGFMASAGVLAVFVGSVVMPTRPTGATWVIALSGVLGVALMSATNIALHSDFMWLLLLPALAWFAALGAYMAGR